MDAEFSKMRIEGQAIGNRLSAIGGQLSAVRQISADGFQRRAAFVSSVTPIHTAVTP